MLAMVYVKDRASAEEVVQDTWLAVVEGLSRFEGRSSLKTWMYRILTYQARRRATRDRRTINWSTMVDSEAEGPTIEPSRFNAEGHWSRPPTDWGKNPEDRLLRSDVLNAIRDAIETLPPVQRSVVLLRDVEGWSSGDVCDTLELSMGNQRVLLHRGRNKLRDLLEAHLTQQ